MRAEVPTTNEVIFIHLFCLYRLRGKIRPNISLASLSQRDQRRLQSKVPSPFLSLFQAWIPLSVSQFTGQFAAIALAYFSSEMDKSLPDEDGYFWRWIDSSYSGMPPNAQNRQSGQIESLLDCGVNSMNCSTAGTNQWTKRRPLYNCQSTPFRRYQLVVSSTIAIAVRLGSSHKWVSEATESSLQQFCWLC